MSNILGNAPEEEEEEDEPIPDLYGNLPSASPSPPPLEEDEVVLDVPRKMAEPSAPALDVRRFNSGKAESNDVNELQSALMDAEARLAAFQMRERKLLKTLTQSQEAHAAMRTYVQDVIELQGPRETAAKKLFLDPYVALEFRLLHDKVAALEASERKLKQDVKAATLTSASATMQSLTAKTRKLQAENQDLVARLGSVKELENRVGYYRAEHARVSKLLSQKDTQIAQIEESRDTAMALFLVFKKDLLALQQQQQQKQQQQDMEQQQQKQQQQKQEQEQQAEQEEVDYEELSEDMAL